MVQNAANYRKSFDYQILARLLGDGLLTSEGEIWRRDRRLQQPLFTGQALEAFAKTITHCAEELAQSLRVGREVVLEEEMTRFGLHVIGERILSLDIRKWSAEVSGHLDVCQRQIVARGLALVDLAKWIDTPGERRFKRSLRALQQIIDAMITERSRLTPAVPDLYSLLTTEGYPHERLRDQLLTLFFVGHETTAIALTWFFVCLAWDPQLDARLASEPASSPLLRQTIDETMRLYPSIGFMGREAIEEDRLGGFTIPKDSIIVLCPYATHRRADLWEDPLKLDPSRFAPGRREQIPVGAHIPFAMGPRGCIGVHFAMLELETVISTLLPRFRFELTSQEPIRPIPLVSMRPSRPVRMRVLARL